MNDKRSECRESLELAVIMVSGEAEVPFFTKNVSISGFQAYSSEDKPGAKSLKTGDMVYVRLPELNMEGVASIRWSELGEDGMFNGGFKYLFMRRLNGSVFRVYGTES